MNKKYLQKHLDVKNGVVKDDLGVIVFKPGYKKEQISSFKNFCLEEKINIIEENLVQLNKDMVIALYQNIFSYSKEDLIFGILWKKDVIEYLTSSNSLCFLVQGKKVIEKLTKYKIDIRAKYGKIKYPKILLSRKEFMKKVIKNIIHVSDECDIQNTLWLLFS